MIEAARKYGKALVNYRNFNAHTIGYVENVKTPMENLLSEQTISQNRSTLLRKHW